MCGDKGGVRLVSGPNRFRRRTTRLLSIIPFLLAPMSGALGRAPVPDVSSPRIQPLVSSPTPAVPAISVLEATIPELQAAMANGSLTSVELVKIYLDRIEAYDVEGARLNAILQVNPRAEDEAKAMDRERAQGRVRGLLHGIPVLLKDNFDVRGMPTTGGSVALAGMIPPDDAFQVKKLREAGAIILAKTNMHELAMGITTVSSLGGQTRNPYDPTRTPGGSTGGTGAAIAAAFGAVGWGTDTCGSIRIPSCFNNLFGFRSTKGLSSIDGIIPLAHTEDVAGPMARNVTDLAIALAATVGPDPADPATRILDGRPTPNFLSALDPNALKGARLGLVEALFGSSPGDEEVDARVRGAVLKMVEAGAEVVPVEIPNLADLVASTSVMDYEAKFDLIDYFRSTPGAPVASLHDIMINGRFDHSVDGVFHVREEMGTRESERYERALSQRDSLGAALLKVMDEYDLDALVYPSVHHIPSIIGERQTGSSCQVSAGSGFPAIAIPSGLTSGGLPTGLELLGRPMDDVRLVAMAFAYEGGVAPWRAPPTAPPLVKGKAPRPVSFDVEVPVVGGGARKLRGRFTFDPVLSTLDFNLGLDGIRREDVYAVTLQRKVGNGLGSVLHRLDGPGLRHQQGTVTLAPREAEYLRAGQLEVVLYLDSSTDGGSRAILGPPLS